jgi:hypothetical protein
MRIVGKHPLKTVQLALLPKMSAKSKRDSEMKQVATRLSAKRKRMRETRKRRIMLVTNYIWREDASIFKILTTIIKCKRKALLFLKIATN